MTPTDKTLLFVYGTLRPPQADTPTADVQFHAQIANLLIAHQPAKLPNAALYNIGTYPAILPGNATVTGDLLEVDADAIALTDQIEGHPDLFTRKQCEVQTTTGSVEAWVYWGSDSLATGKPLIQSGDWFRRTVTIDPVLAKHVQRFAESACSWFATARPDGRAHCAPMWHAWYRGRVYLVAQPTSIKVANIATNPSVTITHPDPSNVLIIEGEAVIAPQMASAIRPIMQAKYDWDITTDSDYRTVIEITPTKLMTWNNSPTQRWTTDEILQIW